MRKIYTYFNYLSLDVALGAAVMSSVISKNITGIVNWNISICLGLAVWIIYTFDHLLDAQKSKQNPIISRHYFHKKNSKPLIISMMIVTCLGWYLVIGLPPKTIKFGFGLLAIVSVYFSVVYFFKGFYLKEIFVAVVYALGIFVGPMSLYPGSIDFYIINLFTQLLVIALVNLTLFSLIEYDLDVTDNHSSLARKMGVTKAKSLIQVLLISLITVQFSTLYVFDFQVLQFAFLTMTIVLWFVLVYHKKLIQNDKYRWLGDAIFFIPLIEFLF